MADTKPTKQWIMGQLISLKTLYSQRNILFDLDDIYYELMFRDQLGLPEEYKELGVVLPTARDIVDAGTNHVSTIYARFLRPVRGTDQDAIEQAEMLRKFDTAMFYRTKIASSVSPWRTAGRHGCLYGMWCLETLYDPNKIPEEPERQSGESDISFEDRMEIYNGELVDALPIVIRAVHPRNVYQDPNGQFTIIEEPKTYQQAKSEWPHLTTQLTVSGIIQGVSVGTSDATQVTYFDKKWRAIYIDGHPTIRAADEEGVIEHDYGIVPYEIGFSGLGNEDKSAKPEKQAVGLIRYLKPLLRSESFAYSVYNIVLKSHSWPITFVSGPGAAAIANIKLKFGKIYEKPPGVTIEEYVQSPPPEMVMQHMMYTNAVLSASGAPRSVRGLPEAGVRSGTDRAQIINKAQLKYNSILEQLQLTTAKVMSNCTKIAERVVPADFHIWAIAPDEEFDFKFDRSKIKRHYTTFVEFTPTSPEEEARRHADMINLVKAEILSPATGRRRYLSHIDPIAEDIRVEANKLRNDPAIRQVLAQIIATELAGEAARLTKIRQLQAGQLPSQASPSMPGGAQALSALGRQDLRQAQPPVIGGPEEQMRQAAQAGVQTRDGGVRIPGAQ